MSNRKLVATALLLAVGVSCGSPQPGAGSSPDDVVSNTPGPDDGGHSGPQRVEARSGLVDVRPTRWDKVVVRDRGRAVDLLFWSGVEECYGVDSVEVEYSKRVVEITINEGREPAAETCIELAVRKVIRVELDEDLDGRGVVDGNAQG